MRHNSIKLCERLFFADLFECSFIYLKHFLFLISLFFLKSICYNFCLKSIYVFKRDDACNIIITLCYFLTERVFITHKN